MVKAAAVGAAVSYGLEKVVGAGASYLAELKKKKEQPPTDPRRRPPYHLVEEIPNTEATRLVEGSPATVNGIPLSKIGDETVTCPKLKGEGNLQLDTMKKKAGEFFAECEGPATETAKALISAKCSSIPGPVLSTALGAFTPVVTSSMAQALSGETLPEGLPPDFDAENIDGMVIPGEAGEKGQILLDSGCEDPKKYVAAAYDMETGISSSPEFANAFAAEQAQLASLDPNAMMEGAGGQQAAFAAAASQYWSDPATLEASCPQTAAVLKSKLPVDTPEPPTLLA
jgi:hypothetical protein